MASKTDYKAVNWRTNVDRLAASDSGRASFVVCCSLPFRNDSEVFSKEHFEEGQTIRGWDITLVIQGLLLQLKVNSAWKDSLVSDYD